MRFVIAVMMALFVGTAYAQAPDRRISDNDGDVLSVNSDGSIPVEFSGTVNITNLTVNNTLLAQGGNLTIGGTGGGLGFNEKISFDFDSASNTVLITSGGSGTVSMRTDNNFGFGLGNGSFSKFQWSTQGNDNLQLGVNSSNSATGSGYFCIMNYSSINNTARSPTTTTSNPTLRVYSSDINSATDYIEFYHDQDSGIVTVGNGNLKFATDIIVTTSNNGQVNTNYAVLASGIAVTPQKGMMYFNGTNFVGWNGTNWNKLD